MGMTAYLSNGEAAVAAVAGLLLAPWAVWTVVKEMRR